MTGQLEMLSTSTYLPSGAGEAVWIGSFGTIYKVPSEATGGAVAIVEHVLGPKQLGASAATRRTTRPGRSGGAGRPLRVGVRLRQHARAPGPERAPAELRAGRDS